MAAELDERLDRGRISLEDGLDLPARQVPHVPGHAARAGAFAHGVAKAHALDAAVDYDVPADRRFGRSSVTAVSAVAERGRRTSQSYSPIAAAAPAGQAMK